MITAELMGPGFFIFFQIETEIPEERPAGGWFDYDGYRPKFKPVGKEQRKAKRVVEEIAHTILATPDIETNKEIDLILRLKLEHEGLVYKQLYLRWLINEAKIERKRKQRNNTIIMLLLH